MRNNEYTDEFLVGYKAGYADAVNGNPPLGSSPIREEMLRGYREGYKDGSPHTEPTA